MELKMNEYQLPGKIGFNYEELKKELTEKTSMYKTLFYTDDQINEAKTDRANLNKLKKALNDERIRKEKEYMKPFNEFKSQINEIIAIIDKPIAAIDKQVKEYDNKQKQKKMEEVQKIWDAAERPDWLRLEQIFDQKWLNVTVSLKAVSEAVSHAVESIEKDCIVLDSLPEYSFEANEAYRRTLDLNYALKEGQRLVAIQKQKAEQGAARRAQEEARSVQEHTKVQQLENSRVLEEERTWVNFSAYLTVEDAKALKVFFNSRNIQFKAV